MFPWLRQNKLAKPSFNWKEVQNLSVPLRVSPRDVIFSGHGAYIANNHTRIPGNVELWLLAQDGGAISYHTNTALKTGTLISKLGCCKASDGHNLAHSKIRILQQGESVPNYVLYPILPHDTKSAKAILITVEDDTPLADLFMHVLPLVEPGKTVRCFWAVYTTGEDPEQDVVYHK